MSPRQQQDSAFANPTMARIYLAQGKLDQAEKLYKALLKQAPDNKTISAALSEIARKRAEIAADENSADQVDLTFQPKNFAAVGE